MKKNPNPKNQVKVVAFYCDKEETWYMIYRYPNSSEPNRSYRLVLDSYVYPTVFILQDIAMANLSHLELTDHINVSELKLKSPKNKPNPNPEPIHFMLNSGDKSIKQKIATAQLDYLIGLYH